MTLYIGLLSGTSIDAIDAALVEFTSTGLELIATHSRALDPELSQALKQLARQTSIDIKTLGDADVALGAQFAEAAHTLIAHANLTADDICAIGSHGQTIHHAPTAQRPFTLQIGDPNVIAEHTGITTVADFRRRDVAAGGQGAPLAPAFHAAAFRQPNVERIIVNIGGIANITRLPASPENPVSGYDCGPGNTLLDRWAQTHLNTPMDNNGDWAAGGNVIGDLLRQWLDDPYFHAPPPKTTGPEYFSLNWLEQGISHHNPQDIQRSLCRLTAQSIADSIGTGKTAAQREVYVCGGGVHNNLLMQDVANCLAPTPTATTEVLGISPDWVEAVAFAWLAKQTLEGHPGSLHTVTGAQRSTLLGGIYPGSTHRHPWVDRDSAG